MDIDIKPLASAYLKDISDRKKRGQPLPGDTGLPRDKRSGYLSRISILSNISAAPIDDPKDLEANSCGSLHRLTITLPEVQAFKELYESRKEVLDQVLKASDLTLGEILYTVDFAYTVLDQKACSAFTKANPEKKSFRQWEPLEYLPEEDKQKHEIVQEIAKSLSYVIASGFDPERLLSSVNQLKNEENRKLFKGLLDNIPSMVLLGTLIARTVINDPENIEFMGRGFLAS